MPRLLVQLHLGVGLEQPATVTNHGWLSNPREVLPQAPHVLVTVRPSGHAFETSVAGALVHGVILAEDEALTTDAREGAQAPARPYLSITLGDT